MVYEIRVHIYDTSFQIPILVIIFGHGFRGVGRTFFKTQRGFCSARAHIQKPLSGFAQVMWYVRYNLILWHYETRGAVKVAGATKVAGTAKVVGATFFDGMCFGLRLL